MATNPFTNTVSNSHEDLYEELISNVVYGETKKVMDKVNDSLGLEEGNYLDDAIQSALSTFQQGMMQSVILIVSEFFIAKSALVLLGLISYIKGTSFIRSLKSKGSSMFNNLKKVKGKSAFRALSSLSAVVSGKQRDTLAIAQITNSSTDNILTNVSIERQNQILLRNQRAQRVDATRANMYSVRNKSRDKNMTLFVWKTSNGMWEKTQKDEKLYKDCVGADSITVPYNADFVAKLNSLADVVKTAKGEIISRAKAEINMITAIGATVKG